MDLALGGMTTEALYAAFYQFARAAGVAQAAFAEAQQGMRAVETEIERRSASTTTKKEEKDGGVDDKGKEAPAQG